MRRLMVGFAGYHGAFGLRPHRLARLSRGLLIERPFDSPEDGVFAHPGGTSQRRDDDSVAKSLWPRRQKLAVVGATEHRSHVVTRLSIRWLCRLFRSY